MERFSFRNTCLNRDTLVLFRFLAVRSPHRELIVQHRLERQETPRDLVPAETVSCSWTRDPTVYGTLCTVPEVELCPGALPCNVKQQQRGVQIRTHALPLRARNH